MLSTFVPLSSLARLELASTSQAFPLAGGKLGGLSSLPLPFPLRSTASLPCKTPLLLLGIIGLAATLLEIEEGHMTLPVKKLQNIHKHHPFHHMNRVRYKCNSALDQVGVELGSKLDPRNFSVLCFLSRDDIC